MSPTRRTPSMRISLPPRLSLCLSQTSDSAPSSPSPHTPLPYEFAFTPALAAQHAENSNYLDALEVSAVGSKRGRDDDEEKVESSWTEEEEEVISSTLMHPFRPLSTTYPPGSLPPPHLIDELTNQILTYAFKPSPTKSQLKPSTSTTSSVASHTNGWPHSWDTTRKKLFVLALAQSKFGVDATERKMSRVERQSRPGLRRVDSMDFLDNAQGEEKPAEGMGRAIRLSTTLQNSAKQEPLVMSRSASLNSGLDPRSRTSTPPPSAITMTFTPATPDAGDSDSDSSTPVPAPVSLPSNTSTSQPLRRKSSFRSSQNRPSRPISLLQRGRSFTASDLQAESDALGLSTPTPPVEEKENGIEIGDAATKPVERGMTVESPVDLSPISPSFASSTGTVNHAQSQSQSLPETHTRSSIKASNQNKNQRSISRSQSSSSLLPTQSHPARDAFLAPVQPSSTDRAVLAIPFSESPSPSPPTTGIGMSKKTSDNGNGNGWSDSDEETSKGKARVVKKLRGKSMGSMTVKRAGASGGRLGSGLAGRCGVELGGLGGALGLGGLGGMGGDGLRSPFEEKSGLEF